MYWRSHLSLQTADVPANQNWFELRWMINVHCQTASWERAGWVFRVIFFVLLASGWLWGCLFLLTKADLLSLCLITTSFPPPTTEAEVELCHTNLEPKSARAVSVRPCLSRYPIRPCSKSQKPVEPHWVCDLEPWDSGLWMCDSPCVSCVGLGRKHKVCGLFSPFPSILCSLCWACRNPSPSTVTF